jgi:hypothetical protein
VICQGHDPGQTIDAVGSVAGQAPFPTAALQAARRNIEAGRQFLQRDTRAVHHFLHHGLRKSLPNSRLEICAAAQGTAQDRFAAQFVNDGSEFAYPFCRLL